MKRTIEIEERKNRLEEAMWKFTDAVDILKDDVLNLIDNNNIPRTKISKDMDNIKVKLITLKNNLKVY